MTLQLNTVGGNLLQIGFGVNEIASAITVGRFVGSIFSRKADSSIFEPLQKQYGIYIRQIPDHLQRVHFDRSGTVLAAGQRAVHVANTLPDVHLDSLSGIATFVVLLLRYVESPDDIVDVLQTLLKGHYEIVCGGKLQPIGSGLATENLPYAIKEPLRTFVRSVLDADADSPQHLTCVKWFIDLSVLVGKAHDFANASKHSHEDHRRFLKTLLGLRPPSALEMDKEKPFHTLSLGTAMIALTAIANGANVELECVTSSGERVTLPEGMVKRSTTKPIRIVFWLCEPPNEIASEIRVAKNFQAPGRFESKPRVVVIYGGIAEIARILARHMGCAIKADDAAALWEEGMKLGEQSSWEIAKPKASGRLLLRLAQSAVETRISAQLEPLIDACGTRARSTNGKILVRKAAYIFHKVHNYRSYKNFGEVQSVQSLDLGLIAFGIGCLKGLISNHSAKLDLFAMTLGTIDSTDTMTDTFLGFCEQIMTSGATVEEILYLAANVWGGLNTPSVITGERVLGIVCPELTFLIDVLQNPQFIAEHGLSKGIMSVYVGSAPILPRDPTYGYIIAGDPNPELVSSHLIVGKPVKPWYEKQNNGPRLIYTVEPYIQSNGSLSALLCAWQHGDVIFQLDPLTVFHNLLSQRRIQDTKPPDLNIERSLSMNNSGFSKHIYIGREGLKAAQYLSVEGGVILIDVGPRTDWQVAAAGCAPIGKAFMVVDAEDSERIKEGIDFFRTPAFSIIIFCESDFRDTNETVEAER